MFEVIMRVAALFGVPPRTAHDDLPPGRRAVAHASARERGCTAAQGTVHASERAITGAPTHASNAPSLLSLTFAVVLDRSVARILACVIACAPAFTAQAQVGADQSASTIEPGVDTSIKPGDDFFAYANGAWLKSTEIPAGKERWTAGNELTELTRKQVLQLLDDAALAPPGSAARKVADFRAAWLDETAIEARGIAPIKPTLDRIDRVRDKAALTRLLGSGLRADVDPLNLGVFDSAHLLGLASEASIHGERNYVAFLVQGGLGLPEREDYFSTAPVKRELRARYQHAVGSVLALTAPRAGARDSADLSKRAEAVIALETAIAQSHATPEASGNERNADNVWTRADFAREAPGMDWPAFFAAAGLASETSFVAWQPGAAKGAAALVASQPLQVWKDYLRVRTVAIYAEVLPRAFADQAPALHGAAAGQPQVPRAQRAAAATQTAMSGAIGRMYAERHLPSAQKARVQAIAANVVAAFARRLQAVKWMSPDSKAFAFAKLKALYFGVGYPERWEDDTDLKVDAADAAGNLRRVADHNYRQTVARLGKAVNRAEWVVAPQWPGALLLFQQNSYNFTAALLQTPKFDAAASNATNYGAIGAIIGHEVTHFVDPLGAEYEADGRRRLWWTFEDIAQYQIAYTPLLNQFSAYRPLPDLALDGKLALSENIADLGGLAAAFDAYRANLAATAGNKAADKEYVRQQDRQFFIGYARAWRSMYREAGLRKQAASDHAPENYRIATVRNIDAWYDAFDVQPGQRLYLEPAARARIW